MTEKAMRPIKLPLTEPVAAAGGMAARSALLIHERRRWSDILSHGCLFLALVLLYFFIVENPRWEWSTVFHYLFNRRVLAGLQNTITLTISSSAVGLILGCFVATLRMSHNRSLRAFGLFYIWVVRATPPLVMLLLLFFMSALVPRFYIPIPFLNMAVIDVDTNTILSRYSAAVLGLAFYLGGYSAEIFRGGLASIDPGQREAAKAIGMSDMGALVHIVIPQAVRVIIPPLSNELITMFKNTSLVSVIGYVELLTTVQLIYSSNFETIPMLSVACIWYFALTSIAMFFQGVLEKKFGKGFAK
jgi:polar amino acid transport system permease protein